MRFDTSMTRLPLALCAAIAATALLPQSASAANHCKLPKRAQVAGKSSLVVAYTLANSEDGKNLYGCRRSNGRRTRIFTGMDDGIESSSAVTKVIVNGRFIGMQIEDYDISCKADCPPGYNPYTYTVARFDVLKRRPLSLNGQAASGALVVSGRFGRIAWVQSAGLAFEVRVNKTTIDTGAIDPASFKLTGSTLSWTNGGVPKTASLK
jgi:hypothetical protein